jgi:hypothetical protein
VWSPCGLIVIDFTHDGAGSPFAELPTTIAADWFNVEDAEHPRLSGVGELERRLLAGEPLQSVEEAVAAMVEELRGT